MLRNRRTNAEIDADVVRFGRSIRVKIRTSGPATMKALVLAADDGLIPFPRLCYMVGRTITRMRALGLLLMSGKAKGARYYLPPDMS
jgi:hypothetical protein